MPDGVLDQSSNVPDPHEEEQDVEAAHRKMEKMRTMDQTEATKRLNAEVPAKLYNRFKSKCETEGRSMSEVLREFLHAYTTD